MTDLADSYQFVIIDPDTSGLRIDKALSNLCEDISRARLQSLIEQGHVFLNGSICSSASKKITTGDVITFSLPEAVAADPQPENIPLDIVYEDEDLIVINKQAGLVVHPGAGNYTGTLVNALLHHCGDSLSGIGGVLRPGIVHRLDKDTSGLMVAAKNDAAHQGLAAQLEDRSLKRIYHALVFKTPMPLKGFVDQPLARHHADRQKMAVNHRNGREARTHYRVLNDFESACSLVECRLETGRTHQIRVHMNFIKHPLIGDPLYGPQRTAVESALKKAGYEADTVQAMVAFPRQALHAKALSFIHPTQEKEMNFETDLPVDMSKTLNLLIK